MDDGRQTDDNNAKDAVLQQYDCCKFLLRKSYTRQAVLLQR